MKSRQGKFIYDRLKSADELVMNYDITVNPPTSFLIPARETLLRYALDDFKIEAVKNNSPAALIGVHPEDINAINLLDEVFMSTNPDPNYSSRRNATVIIGLDNLSPSPSSFAPSMGSNTADYGYDLLFTDLGRDLMVTVGSGRGAELLAKYTRPREPSVSEIARQKQVRDEALSKYQKFLNIPREKIPRLLDDNYDNPYWKQRAKPT